MRSLLLHCYPARWRARYGNEFRAVLDERTLRPSDVVNVVLGAIDAQLQARWTGVARRDTEASVLAARVGGCAAIVGAPLWTAGFVLANQQDRTAADGLGSAAGILVIGSLAMLMALLGLGAMQASIRPIVAWSSSAVPAAGTVAMAIGAVATINDGVPPEALFLGLLMFFVGSLLFGLGAIHAGVLSRMAAVVLTIAPIVTLAGGGGEGAGATLIVGGLIAFDAGWVGLGALAILRSRRAATTLMA